MSQAAISAAPEASGRVRARAEARLRESWSGSRPMDARPMALRLGARASDDAVVHTQQRTMPGELLAASALGVRLRTAGLARPEPNAPLLMRIVRTPYALEAGRPRRSEPWERTADRTIPPRRRPGAEWRSFRPGSLFRSPLRIEHGLPQRARAMRKLGQEDVG